MLKTTDDIIASIADELRDDFLDEVHDLGLDSPIEQVFAAALLYCLKERSREHFFSQICPIGNNTIEDCLADKQRGTRIWPQVQIGQYFVDFLIQDLGQVIIVECDGHEFHERTKHQAEHDKRRDRYFVSRGLSVLHFTGAEIWRGPLVLARSVLDLLNERAADAAFVAYQSKMQVEDKVA